MYWCLSLLRIFHGCSITLEHQTVLIPLLKKKEDLIILFFLNFKGEIYELCSECFHDLKINFYSFLKTKCFFFSCCIVRGVFNKFSR